MTITTTETQRLAQLERTIEKGQKAFIEVGSALREIRDTKLYRSTHGTFAGYVQQRFGFKKSNAYHLIDAADVAENVQHVGQIESGIHAREVAKAPPERQAEVVERAAAIAEQTGTKPTAATYKAAVAEVCAVPDADEWEDVDEDDEPEAEPEPVVTESAPPELGSIEYLVVLMLTHYTTWKVEAAYSSYQSRLNNHP